MLLGKFPSLGDKWIFYLWINIFQMISLFMVAAFVWETTILLSFAILGGWRRVS